MSNSDDTNELDNYGVWVKKPPKDIPVDDSELMDDFNLDSDLPDFSSLDSELNVEDTDAAVETPAEDTVSGDFDISVDGITEESLEDPFADVDFGDTAAEPAATETVEETAVEEPKAEIEEDDFNLDDVTADIPLDDINFDVDTDISLDDSPVTEESIEEPVFDTDVTSDSAVEETAVEEPSLDDFNVEGITESSDSALDFEIDENPNTEIATDSGEISIDEMEDGEVDLDNFLDDSSSESSDSGDSVDVSADFGLDEGSSDNVDLGDFLGDSELSDFGGESKAKTETIEDEDPLNINLSFDESADSFATEDVSETETASTEVASSEDHSTGDDIDTESIDLSDFGVGDEESEFTSSEVTEDKPEVVDYDMKVTADNDDDVKVSMNDVISGNVNNDAADTIEEDAGISENISDNTEMSAKGQEILQQIVGELASLKDEIKNLKTDFAEIKTGGSNFEIKKEEENTGFFSDGDEDDTIALSGDELDNILSNAEFLEESGSAETEEASVEQPAIEEDVNDETTVSNGQFEATIDESAFEDESIFDEHADEDIKGGTAEISEDLPDEIEIPKLDDESDDIVASDFTSNVDEDPLDSMLSEDTPISDSLTDDKIDYITEDSNGPVDEDELADLDLPSPTLEDAFEQQSDVDDFKAEIEPDVTIEEEPVVEETAVEEPALDDDSSIFEEESQPAVVSNDEITGDLKSEIKSVLSYMDQLLENLPEDKISEFAQSEHFVTYKKLFQELGLS
ncbi:MAG: hypothetical protein KBS84_09045 [Treponema sp.]|nr:hypothetical protein [Candidatus Treponema scatequi]